MDDTLRQQLAGKFPSNANLMDAEKEELRLMAQEGRPLYKILKSALDHADALRDTIAQTPLHTEEGLALARQLQLRRTATLDLLKWMVEQFDDPLFRAQRTKGHSNG